MVVRNEAKLFRDQKFVFRMKHASRNMDVFFIVILAGKISWVIRFYIVTITNAFHITYIIQKYYFGRRLKYFSKILRTEKGQKTSCISLISDVLFLHRNITEKSHNKICLRLELNENLSSILGQTNYYISVKNQCENRTVKNSEQSVINNTFIFFITHILKVQ